MALTLSPAVTGSMLLHYLLVSMVIVSGVYVPETPEIVYPDCPNYCQCSNELQTAHCTASYVNYSVDPLLPWKLEKLVIFGDGKVIKSKRTHMSLENVILKQTVTSKKYIPADLHAIFSQLRHLDASVITIQQILKGELDWMQELIVLNLAFNNISNIQLGAFDKLKNLQVLNLDGNQIQSLPDYIFSSLKSLKELRLNGNGLMTLTSHILDGLGPGLEYLFLQNNNLRNMDSFLDNMTAIRTLDISGNKIPFVLNQTVETLSRFESVDISKNPFQCSCTIGFLIQSVQTLTSTYANDVTCAGPAGLIGLDFTKLDPSNLPCDASNITSIIGPSDMLYQGDLTLSCMPVGAPPVGVYWLTPWGDTFSHESLVEIFPNIEGLAEAKHDSEFYGVNLILVSHIYVSQSGSLHIDKFRGIFSGNFTCVSVNLIGQSNKTMHVGISTNFRNLYLESLFIGGYCSGGMLALAIIIGAIRFFVNKCLHPDHCNCCCCRCDDLDVYTKGDEIEEKDVEIVYSSSDSSRDENNFDPDCPPPGPPVNSPQERLSPSKCETPSEMSDENKPHIWDQLDEVRMRLKYGAGRKMEKVRSYVGSITDTGSLKIRNMKDAGTIKLQSIKETSSNAATYVKKNVTSGMEQVKYGVQSIKEFCGTGEMGPGTISMVSFSTDIDTKEQVKIVRSHTFV